MTVSVALFDTDTNYTERLMRYFQTQYAKQIRLSVFSSEEIFLERLEYQHFALVIVDEEHCGLIEKIPEKLSRVMFVKDNSISEIKGISVIGKYQQMDSIYKSIMNKCAKELPEVKLKLGGKGARIIMVTSAQGGCGVSTIAAACAMNFAYRQKRTLYLPLNNTGSGNMYFHGEGEGSFSDVIFAIKSSEANFALTLKSLIKTDNKGVGYISETDNTQEMMELKDSEIELLVNTLKYSESLDYIVIDYSSDISIRQKMLICDYADSCIYVSDGTENGKYKFNQFCNVMRFIEKREKCSVLDKIALLNNYIKTHDVDNEVLPVQKIGNIKRFDGYEGRKLAGIMASEALFDDIY